MIQLFEYTELDGVYVITYEKHPDDRGCFYESFKHTDCIKYRVNSTFLQDNISFSKKNVIRGLHYQLEHPQVKIVQVIKGRILDVAVDIRLSSPTFGQYVSVELSDTNNKMLYIPEGFAHGFLTLDDENIVSYKCSNEYAYDDQYGIRYDDKDIEVNWSLYSDTKNYIVSYKDKQNPYLKDIDKKYLFK